MSFVVFVLKKYLKPRMETDLSLFAIIVSISGIAIGVMALIVVVSVMTGFELELKSQILKAEPHIIIRKFEGKMSNYTDLVKQIRTIPGVEEAGTFVETKAVISNKKNALGTTIKGIQGYNDNVCDHIGGNPVFSLHDPSSLMNSPIILNIGLMRALGLDLGEYVYVILPEGNLSLIGYIPRIKKFQISGFINSNKLDTIGGYISISEAQKLLKVNKDVSGIELRVSNPTNMKGTMSSLLSKLGNLKNSLEIETWLEKNGTLLRAMKLERIFMFIILSLIVLMSTFSLTASLVMFAYDKRKEISILKSMGATNDSIRQIFAIKGLLVGLLGTLIGTFGGIIVVKCIDRVPVTELLSKLYPSTTLFVSLEFYNIVMVMSSALLMSFVAVIHPAYKVSKMETINL